MASSDSGAVSKFGNAKSISSDMFFGGESSSERDANLTRSILSVATSAHQKKNCRFQGSNSISSDMYFNRDTATGGGMKQSQSYYSNMQVFEDREIFCQNHSFVPRLLTWTM